MNASRTCNSCAHGFSLIELMVVMLIFMVVAGLGTLCLGRSLGHEETRGAAQTWQAACAWTQLGVLWQGGSGRVTCARGYLAIAHSASRFGGVQAACGSSTSVSSTLARWTLPDGVSVVFSGALASPDGGGSILFRSPGAGFRVAVRPESGLAVRSWVGDE
jgi:prepilin-type N-terminal cleavage/methylation domain-containing protein